MAQQPIVDFDVTDGFTPQQTAKLNTNFRMIQLAINQLLHANDENKTKATIGEIGSSSALKDADQAAQAAAAAQSSADAASEAAEDAQESADDAMESAISAGTSARGALTSLSEVERVVGTLNWIAEHGRYVLTQDTVVQDGKAYYIENAGGYEIVREPVDEDLDEYYELVVDESVQNYIASHLSLTNEGLNLTADNNKYRAVLASDGLRIIDPVGNIVGLHGQVIQLGEYSGVHFEANANQLAFKTGNQLLAWFGQNSDGIWEMHIQNTYAEDMVRFGDYAFIKRANGNMSLKWLGALPEEEE